MFLFDCFQSRQKLIFYLCWFMLYILTTKIHLVIHWFKNKEGDGQITTKISMDYKHNATHNLLHSWVQQHSKDLTKRISYRVHPPTQPSEWCSRMCCPHDQRQGKCSCSRNYEPIPEEKMSLVKSSFLNYI